MSTTRASIKGFYNWTWSSGTAPPDADLDIAFSGWTDPNTALGESDKLCDKLVGKKFISLGGGNKSGSWNAINIDTVTSAVKANAFVKYDGIVFDIEEGDGNLENGFAALFSMTKSKNLQVIVTISHSAPYGIPDANSLMASFFSNDDIDYISPQLYTSGEESENDYDTSQGVEWSQYADSKAAIVVSIVKADYYNQGNTGTNAKQFFEQQGVELAGYIQWSQSS